MLGVDFFSSEKFHFDVLTSQFDKFISSSKSIVVMSSNLKRYFTCDHFSQRYGVLDISISANLGKLPRDIFCAINA